MIDESPDSDGSPSAPFGTQIISPCSTENDLWYGDACEFEREERAGIDGPVHGTDRDRIVAVAPAMNPRYVDAVVDLTYGVLIFVSIALIVRVGTGIGLAFGFGVLVSYAIHVVWKMARFDPDWMTTAVEERIEETVEQSIEESVRQEVEPIHDQIETVEHRVDRRPREDEVEEMIDETADGDAHGRSDS